MRKPANKSKGAPAVAVQRMVLTHPFKWKKLPSLKDGYGNRHAIICNGCNETLVRGDWGNATGERYFRIDAERACKSHTRRCEKVRELIKNIKTRKRQNARITDAAPPSGSENTTDAPGRRSRASDC